MEVKIQNSSCYVLHKQTKDQQERESPEVVPRTYGTSVNNYGNILNQQGKDQLFIKLPGHFVKVKHFNDRINHRWIMIQKVVIKSIERKCGEFGLVLIAE